MTKLPIIAPFIYDARCHAHPYYTKYYLLHAYTIFNALNKSATRDEK